MFDPLYKIQTLELQGNKFTELPEDIFHKLTALQVLELGGGHLRKMYAPLCPQPRAPRASCHGRPWQEACGPSCPQSAKKARLFFHVVGTKYC